MAKENIIAEEIKNEENDVKVNEAPTGNTESPAIQESDAFEYRRKRAEEGEYHREEDTVIYGTPLDVQRYGSNSNGDRVYYNYAVGYKARINGKEIAQAVQFQPGEKRANAYDLLDAIFGEGDRSKLYIVRTARTVTVNGVTRTSYTYTAKVSSFDEAGVEFSCSLVPSGSSSRQSFNNLITKLKAMDIVK